MTTNVPRKNSCKDFGWRQFVGEMTTHTEGRKEGRTLINGFLSLRLLSLQYFPTTNFEASNHRIKTKELLRNKILLIPPWCLNKINHTIYMLPILYLTCNSTSETYLCIKINRSLLTNVKYFGNVLSELK